MTAVPGFDDIGPLPDKIVCVECGGTAYCLVRFPEDDPPTPGEIVPYRCGDCYERLDLVFDAD